MAVPTKAAKAVASAAPFKAFRHANIVSTLASDTKYIGTHSGSFHCDEALAVSLLKLLPQFETHDIVRSRDPAILQQCDIVVDVGGEYSPENLRFDHHQKTFESTFDDAHKTKLSSAGLVYKHFGREIIQVLAEKQLDEATLDTLHRKAYDTFIEHVDGIDNGIEAADGQKNYQVTTTLSARVGFLNPGWNEDQSSATYNACFNQAMYLTLTEFTDCIHDLVHSWLPARSIVEKAVQDRFRTHESGEIMYLPQFCPWKSHLHDVEESLLIPGQIKFVLYNDNSGDSVRVQGVNTEPGSFALRRALHPEWRGLRDEEVSQKAGIEGCIFVHNAGFIGGNKTYEGALKMASKSLEEADK